MRLFNPARSISRQGKVEPLSSSPLRPLTMRCDRQSGIVDHRTMLHALHTWCLTINDSFAVRRNAFCRQRDRQRDDCYVLSLTAHRSRSGPLTISSTSIADHDLAPVDRDNVPFRFVYSSIEAGNYTRASTNESRARAIATWRSGTMGTCSQSEVTAADRHGSTLALRSNRFLDCVPPNTHPPLRNRRIKRLRGLERVTKRSIGLSG